MQGGEGVFSEEGGACRRAARVGGGRPQAEGEKGGGGGR